MSFERTLNIPLEALRFLQRTNQSRSQFEIAGEERADIGRLVVLRFKEQARPRLIRSPQEVPASGRFWIEPTSGVIVRSELKISGANVSATITVRYAPQFEPAVWLPASMNEEYRLYDRPTSIGGDATYSNFRRFRVDVATDIKTICSSTLRPRESSFRGRIDRSSSRNSLQTLRTLRRSVS
jgi:hypothetical protein